MGVIVISILGVDMLLICRCFAHFIAGVNFIVQNVFLLEMSSAFGTIDEMYLVFATIY